MKTVTVKYHAGNGLTDQTVLTNDFLDVDWQDSQAVILDKQGGLIALFNNVISLTTTGENE